MISILLRTRQLKRTKDESMSKVN